MWSVAPSRWCIAVLSVLLGCLPASADESELGKLLASVQAPLTEDAEYQVISERREEIRKVSQWEAANEDVAAEIYSVLLSTWQNGPAQIRPDVAAALGHRGHRELIPALFAEADNDPQSLRRFFDLLPDASEAPVEFLRIALLSANPQTANVALDLVARFKCRELQPVLEQLVFAGRAQIVRKRAAEVLSQVFSGESAAALRKALWGPLHVRYTVAMALARCGREEDLAVLLPMIRANVRERSSAFIEAVASIQAKDSAPLREALIGLLRDESEEVRTAALASLPRYADEKLLPELEEAALGSRGRKLRTNEKILIVKAVEAIEGKAAAKLLNRLLNEGYAGECGLEDVLMRRRDPSSAHALWLAYLSDPVRSDRGSHTRGYLMGLKMLTELADEEIFKAIRLRALSTPDQTEAASLAEIAQALRPRFPDASKIPFDELITSATMEAPDRDGDGVSDRHDLYPDDPRRSKDIPVLHDTSADSIPGRTYIAIPLATKGPAAGPIVMEALGEYSFPLGWLTRANEAQPPDWHVIKARGMELEEWPLPNPGDTPGIFEIKPSSINADATVVGTALRTKRHLPLRQDLGKPHITYKSGFIFENGKIRFDPPPPFAGEAVNVAYLRINNRGVIFGQREQRIRGRDTDEFRMVSFLGDHHFHDTPAFDVIVLTDPGQMLCYRAQPDGTDNFVWDGKQFQDLGSLGGKPRNVRPYGMNEKLQVIGVSDIVDRDGCPVGFFWEKGRMQPLTDLIPEEHRGKLRSVVPYLIETKGQITFAAEVRAGPFPGRWPVRSFVLQLKEGGNELHLMDINMSAMPPASK